MSKRNCLDCKHCFIEDLWNDICCGRNGRYTEYIGNDHIYEKSKECKHYEQEKREK